MNIQLVNYEIGYGVPPRPVQGYSGKTYAKSRYSSKLRCHVAEISVADYNKAALDLSKAWHMARRKWVPIIPEVEEGPDALQKVDTLPIGQLSNIADSLKSAAQSAIDNQYIVKSDEIKTRFSRETLEGMHLSTLKKTARDAGLVAESTGTREEIIAALLA
jgi:hypothetical protein